ncbi:hypothetical protein [Pendulispora albinea]|uniref:Uncharacterized protein n=1 Tax=Pendulispora albinea TaxID=2741071 RepID=A0ABZ2MA26_9BACT
MDSPPAPPSSEPTRVTALEGLVVAISDDGARVIHVDRGPSGSPAAAAYLTTYDVRTGRAIDRLKLDMSNNLNRARLRLVRETFWKMNQYDPTPQLLSACSAHSPSQGLDISDISVRFEFPRLQVTQSGRNVLTRSVAAWSYQAKDDKGRIDQDCVMRNAMVLNTVYLDHASNVMVLLVGYCGSDMCPEPADHPVITRLR